MSEHRKKRILTAAVFLLLVFIAYSCRLAGMLELSHWPVLAYIRSAIYIVLFCLWAVSIHTRIMQSQTRGHLVAAALLMVFWIFIRAVKFHVVKDPFIEHRMWYLFYFPLIFIPLFSLYVSQSICRKEDYRLPDKLLSLYVPATFLLLMVVTNDYHQTVFRFTDPYGAEPWNTYRYGIGFLVVFCWIVFCFVCTIVSFLQQNRMVDKRRRILVPAAILALLWIYTVLYAVGTPFIKVWFGDLTVIFCLLLVLFFESFIQLNLIRSNTQYGDLFRHSSIPAVIVDNDGNEQISTEGYTAIPDEMMKHAEQEPFVTGKGIRLSQAPIRNGKVFWKEDISELAELNEKLHSTSVSIEEQNAAAMEAYKAERQRRQLEEKNRLYDKLQSETRGKVEELSSLLDALEKADDEETERRLLLRISVIGAYIKRRSSLSFLSEDWEQFPARVLNNCIVQSIDCLTLFGVEAEQAFDLTDDMPIAYTIRLYEAFEEVTERSLDTLSELFLTLVKRDYGPFMTLRLCTEEDLSGLSMDGLLVRKEGEGEWLLSYPAEKGGVSA